MDVKITNNLNTTDTYKLISYFEKNNKKFLFYTKEELVQQGLIKMYVAIQNEGLNETISQDEWTELKTVMQQIIKGEKPNVTFLKNTDNISVGEEKVIALNNANIEALKNGYNVNIPSDAPISNKDMLSMQFNAQTPSMPEQIVPLNPVEPTITDLETKSASLNMEPPKVEPIIPDINSNPNEFSNVLPEIKTEETIVASQTPSSELNLNSLNIPANNASNINVASQTPTSELKIESITNPVVNSDVKEIKTEEPKKEENVLDSPFNIGSSTNIFDNLDIDDEPTSILETKDSLTPTEEIKTEENKIETNILTNNKEKDTMIKIAEIDLEYQKKIVEALETKINKLKEL